MAIGNNQPAVINGAVLTGQGSQTFLNVTTKTLVKSVKGRICRVNVTVSGGTNSGAIYDSATTSGTGASNLVAVIPDAVGSYQFDFPCANGIVVDPGTGNTVSVSFN